MPRRKILSSEEKERLLVVSDDDVLLTHMSFLSGPYLAQINKAGQLTAWALLFYFAICEGQSFSQTKVFYLTAVLSPAWRLF